MFDISIYIDFLKYGSIAVSISSAIVALWGDNINKRTRKLNKKGKWLFVLIALSGLSSLVLQVLQNVKDTKEKHEREIEKAVEKNRLDSIKTTVIDAANPIKDISYSIEILPDTLDGFFKSFFRRIKIAALDSLDDELDIQKDSSLYPNTVREQKISGFFEFFYIEFSFFKNYPKRDTSKRFTNRDLSFQTYFGSDLEAGDCFIKYFKAPRHGVHFIFFESSGVSGIVRNGDIQSLFDLNNSYLVVSIRSYDAELDSHMPSIIKQFDNLSLVIDGHSLNLKFNPFAKLPGGKGKEYILHFPKDIRVLYK